MTRYCPITCGLCSKYCFIHLHHFREVNLNRSLCQKLVRTEISFVSSFLFSSSLLVCHVLTANQSVTHAFEISWGFDLTDANLTVGVGDTVKWKLDQDQSTPHSVVFADFQSASLSFGATFAHMFTAVGVFPYQCGIHSSMTGVITVLDGSC